jgi:hypothetical protein
MLDFERELRELHPDLFVVNEDGNTPDKRQLCAELGIEYVILKREPHAACRAAPPHRCARWNRCPTALIWPAAGLISRLYPGITLARC